MSAFTLLAFQARDGGSNVLGWLIVFFMVIWPVIRGVVEAANERRRKFIEAEQRRPKGGVAGGRPERRDPFEALRRALEEAHGIEVEAEEPPRRSAGTPTAGPARSAAAPAAPVSRRPAARAQVKPAPPRPAEPAPRSTVAPEGSFGRDPLDERALERPLVAERDLARVPSEGGAPSEAPQRRATPSPAPPTQDPPAPHMEPAAAAVATRLQSRDAARGGTLDIARLARRARTPWAAAVLYEELLGPPVSLREPRF